MSKKLPLLLSVLFAFVVSSSAFAGMALLHRVTMNEKGYDGKMYSVSCQYTANFVELTPAKWSESKNGLSVGNLSEAKGCAKTVVCQLDMTCTRKGSSDPVAMSPVCSADFCAKLTATEVAGCINEYEQSKFGTTTIQQGVLTPEPRFSTGGNVQ